MKYQISISHVTDKKIITTNKRIDRWSTQKLLHQVSPVQKACLNPFIRTIDDVNLFRQQTIHHKQISWPMLGHRVPVS